MNKRDWVVLATIVDKGYKNHRTLSEVTAYSLGLINSSLRKLVEKGYLDDNYGVTEETFKYIEKTRPKRAIILAAGPGLRMMPISKTPKPLLKINNERLIERVIKQLHSVGVKEIHAVVGYEMERLEYLSHEYGVHLIYDANYAKRDSLYSLSLAGDFLANSYIVPGNVWFAKNPFSLNEYFSWYAISAFLDDDSYLRLNRKMELVYIEDEAPGNSMIGLSYLTEEDSKRIKEEMDKLNQKRKYRKESWERVLFVKNKLIPYARVMLGQSAYQIRTYEDLRDLDSHSKDLHSQHLNLISRVFGVPTREINYISGLFKGMTNNLMRFSVHGKPYLLRIPGAGSNELTDRQNEAAVYKALEGKDLTDKIVYISGESGYKIAHYWGESRTCDSSDPGDVKACMEHLKRLHDMKLEVDHSFEPIQMLKSYEALLSEAPSFEDYYKTREKIMHLHRLLSQLPKSNYLCHIDPVSDNFLFVDEKVYLIDWEYAGMSDPAIDVAMFAIYADYDKEGFERAMEFYYKKTPTILQRFKVYSYAAIAGLLWSVWCEYKAQFGINYGEYAIKQYRYARNFYNYATELLNEPELKDLMKAKELDVKDEK